mgnify:CR=1 FL=1
MTDTLQSIGSIDPASNKKVERSDDPVEAEYEDGKRFYENEEYGQAAVALHNALIGYEERKDESGIANVCNQLGNVCLARKEYENALKHYQRALDICDGSYDRMSVLAVSKPLVAVYRGLGQSAKAIATCLDMVDLYQDNRDPQGTVTVLEEMASIYIDSGEKEKAADSYRTIAAIHKNFSHNNIAASFIEKADTLLSDS